MRIKKYLPEILVFSALFALHLLMYREYAANLPALPEEWIPLMQFQKGAPYRLLLNNFSISGLFSILRSYTPDPAYLIITSAMHRISGGDYRLAILLTNIPSFLLIYISTYLLGRKAAGRAGGNSASIAISLIPAVFLSFRTFYLNYHLIWVTAASIWLLMESDSFRRRGYSVCFALIFSFGLYVKYPFALYLSGPLIISAIAAIRTALKEKDFLSLKNLALAVGLILVLSLPHFINPEKIAHIMRDPFTERTGLLWYSFLNLQIFTTGLWEEQLSLPFLILLIPSVYLFLKIKNSIIKTYTALWICVPVITLILIPHWKDIRYFLPLIPAYAVIIGTGTTFLLRKKAGKLFIAAILLLSLFQIYDFSFSETPVLLNRLIYRNRPKHISVYYYRLYPELSFWNERTADGTPINRLLHTELINAFKEMPRDSDEPFALIVPPQYILNTKTLKYQVSWLYYFEGTLPEELNGRVIRYTLDDYLIDAFNEEKEGYLLTISSDYWPFAELTEEDYPKRLFKDIVKSPRFHSEDEDRRTYDLNVEDIFFSRYNYLINIAAERRLLFSEETDNEWMKVFLYRLYPSDKIPE